MKRFFLIQLIITISCFFLKGQTIIDTSNVNGIWTKEGNPYYINNDINILSGDTLIINPGVEIIFSNSYYLNIYGKLSILGSETEKVIIDAADTSSCDLFNNGIINDKGWAGIKFQSKNINDTIDIKNCIFKNSGFGIIFDESGTGYGRGWDPTIYINDSNIYRFYNCLFESNYHENGEIIIKFAKEIKIKNCTFRRSYVGPSYNASYITIGDINENKIKNNVIIDNCDFSYNIGLNDQCIIALYSDLIISNSRFSNLRNEKTIFYSGRDLQKCIIENNLFYKNRGFAIQSFSERTFIRNNQFIGHKNYYNGLIHLYCADNSYIIGNLIAYNDDNSHVGNFDASAIKLGSSDALIANNTIVHNECNSYGKTIYASNSRPTIINNIMYNNVNEGIGWYGGAGLGNEPPIVENNLIQGGYSSGTNFDFNPQFELSDTLDFKLSELSDCINKGIKDTSGLYLPKYDLAGNCRLDSVTNLIDLGAFEYPLINHDPTDIKLSDSIVNNGTSVGTIIGKFAAEDVDANQNFIFTLVNGDGTNDYDNDKFTINYDSLFINVNVDYSIQNKYHIYINVSDKKGGNYKKAFQISVSINNNIDILNEDIVIISPNPSSGLIKVKFSNNYVSYKCRIFDNQSKIVFNKVLNSSEDNIDLSYSPKGIYLLLLENENQTVSKKIVIF